MADKLRNLKAQRAKHVAAISAIYEAATGGDGRPLTDQEKLDIEALKAKISVLDDAITIETHYAVAAGATVDQPALPNGGARRSILEAQPTNDDPTGGFKSLGEFLRAVYLAGRNGPHGNNFLDPRLHPEAAAPGTVGSEITGPDGGFAVPPQFARTIYTLALGEDSLLPFTDNVEVDGNGMVFPKDETTPWGTTGIRAYWQAEATAANPTKPLLGTTVMRLHKMMALVPLTDELVSDTNALNSYVPLKVGQSIRWKANESLLFGTGAGQPIGAFNALGATQANIVQAKDTGQATLTLTIGNVTNMIARLPPGGSYARAVWLITPDALPALFQMTLGNYPIYLPMGSAPNQGGAQASPFGLLLGRPAFVSQHAAAFSSQGDLLLVDWNYYRTITKTGGLQTATSMHLYFDADAIAFRTTFRLDGQPAILNPIAQAKGAKTLSPFIQLAAR